MDGAGPARVAAGSSIVFLWRGRGYSGCVSHSFPRVVRMNLSIFMKRHFLKRKFGEKHSGGGAFAPSVGDFDLAIIS